MPASAAQVVDPTAIAGAKYLAVLTEVRRIRHLATQAALRRILLIFSGTRQRPEIAAERNLLVVADRRTVEYQDGMIVDRFLDQRDVVWRNRLPEIDVGDLGNKTWTYFPNQCGHSRAPFMIFCDIR